MWLRDWMALLGLVLLIFCYWWGLVTDRCSKMSSSSKISSLFMTRIGSKMKLCKKLNAWWRRFCTLLCSFSMKENSSLTLYTSCVLIFNRLTYSCKYVRKIVKPAETSTNISMSWKMTRKHFSASSNEFLSIRALMHLASIHSACTYLCSSPRKTPMQSYGQWVNR